MTAEQIRKIDRLLALLEPPKPKAKKTFEQEVKDYEQRLELKYLRKNLKQKC
jgi:hypothetical protein